jgi:hypothetical protein
MPVKNSPETTTSSWISQKNTKADRISPQNTKAGRISLENNNRLETNAKHQGWSDLDN